MINPLISFVVDSESGCWLWQRAKQSAGYGHFVLNGKHQLAHRYLYELLVDFIPPGMFLCHKCDNPGCVNPGHMFVGTRSDNMRDCSRKGRINFQKHPGINRRENNGRAYLKPEQILEFHRLRAEGWTYYRMGKHFGIPPGTIHSAVNDHWPELRKGAQTHGR